MILIALLIGVVLIVAALRNSQAALFTALGKDVPEFIVWGAAIFAVGVVGFVPGLKPISRGLLALVIIVIVLNNYQKILDGFQTLANTRASTATPNATATASGAATSPTTSLGNSPAQNAAGASLTDPSNFAEFISNAMGAG